MSLSRLVPIGNSEIHLDVPVPYSIYDGYGRLLLRRGLLVHNPHHLEYLLALGMREEGSVRDGPRPPGAFERMGRIAHRLAATYQHLRNSLRGERNDSINNVADHIRALAQAILSCTQEDADAAFAMPHLDRKYDYEVVHHLMTAVVCARQAQALGWDGARQESLVAAALTQDIALLPLRGLLESQKRLNDVLQQQVRAHAETGAQWLERLGVQDPVWLGCVRQHHEALDGSGYPASLKGNAILAEARIATLADALSAMLRPRPYRGRVLAKKALAELYANHGGRYDPSLINGLIRSLGIYPPGSVVGLANGETGVVVHSRAGILSTPPEVHAVFDASGRELLRPTAVDAADPQCAIVCLKEPENCHRIWNKLGALWDKPLLEEPEEEVMAGGLPEWGATFLKFDREAFGAS